MFNGTIQVLGLFLVISSSALAAWDPAWDDRTALVATDTSGCGHALTPQQGPQFFDALALKWWYNYLPDSSPSRTFPGYSKLYMYWRATIGTASSTIQANASAAKAAYPGETIWWSMSNEPNDYGQANQAANTFADIYYKFHKNIKIADPDAKIIGPGILNWTFQSTSVWKKGKDWYEEFRQAWYNNPTYRAYSQANYGTDYPPQDGFNFHSYDLWGFQGTPYRPLDWRYCRDEIVKCYNDILTYPEVLQKEIWLTEFGGLRAGSHEENAAYCTQLVGWMRDQSYVKRWFWFINHSDCNGNWPNVELLDEYGQRTAVGNACRDLAILPRSTRVVRANEHYLASTQPVYLRTGWSHASNIVVNATDYPSFGLTQSAFYQGNTMFARSFQSSRTITKVKFRYESNYDNSKVTLFMDAADAAGSTRTAWSYNVYGSSSNYIAVDFPFNDQIRTLSFGLQFHSNFTYTQPTSNWHAWVKDLVLFTEESPASVDHGAYFIYR